MSNENPPTGSSESIAEGDSSEDPGRSSGRFSGAAAGDPKAREQRLRSMPVGPLLTSLSLPAMAAMFINALYNLVDAIFVGQAVGTDGMAALSLAFPIQMLIGAVGLMFGVGGASMASRFLGAGRREDADRTLGTAMVFVLILGLITFSLLQIFLDEVLIFVGATEGTLPLARDYARIVLFGFIPLSMAMTANNFIRAEGNARMSMIIMMTGAITNLILDPIYIFVFDWGVQGAALATITGQTLNFILGYRYLLSRRSNYHIKLRYLVPRIDLVKEISGLGVATFVRQIGTSAFLIVVNNLIRSFSDAPGTMIAVMGVINRLMMFSLMPLFGLVQGMQPIAGYNYGARLFHRVKEVVNTAFRRGMIIAALAFAMFMLFPGALMRAFGSDPDFIERGTYFLRVVFLMVALVPLQIVGAAYFQALGKMLPAFFLSTSRQFILLLPMVVIFAAIGGIPLMAWAFPAADFITIIITMVWFRIDSARLFTEPAAS
jgi:putative MATE family efflux protein